MMDDIHEAELNISDLSLLANELDATSGEIQEFDCPGNINADIPAMVLTDLASFTLSEWVNDATPKSRDEVLAKLCGSLAYMFDWFKSEASEQELAPLRALTDALDTLTNPESRPRAFVMPQTLH